MMIGGIVFGTIGGTHTYVILWNREQNKYGNLKNYACFIASWSIFGIICGSLFDKLLLLYGKQQTIK